MLTNRIARTKKPFLGCVTEVQIGQSIAIGGYLKCRTTATRNWWVTVPVGQFKLIAENLRFRNHDMRIDNFTMKDAKAVSAWLKAKMILIECVVSVDEQHEHYYDCRMVGLMEGESNV